MYLSKACGSIIQWERTILVHVLTHVHSFVEIANFKTRVYYQLCDTPLVSAV